MDIRDRYYSVKIVDQIDCNGFGCKRGALVALVLSSVADQV
jgi:hypothetical protein